MNNGNHLRNIAIGCFTIGVLLLALHSYWFCYPQFDRWGWTTPWLDRILLSILKSGLLSSPWRTKFFAILFLVVYVFVEPSWHLPWLKRGTSWLVLLLGLATYWFAVDYRDGGILYLIAMLIGSTAILFSLGQLTRHMPLPWSKNDPFGRRRSGFPQDGQKREATAALCLRGRYTYNGQVRDSWINFVNPRRGILILGTPGSGKSRFIIEPLIRQLIEQGTALFVYDYKYDALTRLVFSLFQTNKARYPHGTTFHCINFNDLSTTARCNVLDPESLEYVSDAIGASKTILLSLNKSWVDRQGDFWVESAVNFVAALIWYLRHYKGGIYCTLPHVIELSKMEYELLFALLEQEPSLSSLADPFIQAYRNESKEMLEGQLASAKIPMARLSSPDLYYILTGNEVDLQINKLGSPSILCLGGDPRRKEALAPILSLYIDRLTRLCNRPGQHPCALVCDEFASVRAYTMLDTMATGRAHNIVTVLAVQDISQLRSMYSRNEADEIVNISGNLVCGQVGGDTAKMMSERFPRVLRERSSVSENTRETTTSRHQDWEQPVTPATVATLSSGEFLGVLADEPMVKLENKTFHALIIREPLDEIPGQPVPALRVVHAAAVQDTFRQVQADIGVLVSEVQAMVMAKK
jgi:hypothetical protein